MGREYFIHRPNIISYDNFKLTDTYKFKNDNIVSESLEEIEKLKNKIIIKKFNGKKYFVPVDYVSTDIMSDSYSKIRNEINCGLCLNYDNSKSDYEKLYEEKFKNKFQQAAMVDIFYNKYFLETTEDEDDYYNDDEKVFKHNLSGEIIIDNPIEHISKLYFDLDANCRVTKLQLSNFRGIIFINIRDEAKRYSLKQIICPKAKLNLHYKNYEESILNFNILSCSDFNIDSVDELNVKQFIINEPVEKVYSSVDLNLERLNIDTLEINSTKPISADFSYDFKRKKTNNILNIKGDSNLLLDSHYHKKGVNLLKDKSFAITGRLECYSRDHLTEKLENRGAKVLSGVKDGLDYLISDDINSTSTKSREAIKRGVKILDSKSIGMLLDYAENKLF